MKGRSALAGTIVVFLALAASCTTPSRPPWDTWLAEQLPVFGHRNWIVVADSAYPAQSRSGIQTVYIGGDQLEAVRKVLASIDDAPHVRANVYVDAELANVPATDAPGIDDYRVALDALLEGRSVQRVAHGDVIAELDKAAQTFAVIVLKTEMTLPYTSVFLELDCGYWTTAAENRMRRTMQGR